MSGRETTARGGVPERDVREARLRDLEGTPRDAAVEPSSAPDRQDAFALDDPLAVQAHPSAAPAPDPATGEVGGSGGWGLGANNATAGVVPGRDATPLTRTGDSDVQAGRTSPAARPSPRGLTVTDGEVDPPAGGAG